MTYEQQARQILTDEDIEAVLHAKGECEHFISDEEANSMGLDAMMLETDRCAKEFTATVERWAEAASKLIQRQVKVV